MNTSKLLIKAVAILGMAAAYWATSAQADEIDSLNYNFGSGQSYTVTGSSDYGLASFSNVNPGVSFDFADAFVLADAGGKPCTTSYSGGNFSLGDCSDAYLANFNGVTKVLDLYLVSTGASQADLNAFYAGSSGGFGNFLSVLNNSNNQTEETGGLQVITNRFDPSKGTVTVQSQTSDVPEPASLSLLAVGFASRLATRRRKAR